MSESGSDMGADLARRERLTALEGGSQPRAPRSSAVDHRGPDRETQKQFKDSGRSLPARVTPRPYRRDDYEANQKQDDNEGEECSRGADEAIT